MIAFELKANEFRQLSKLSRQRTAHVVVIQLEDFNVLQVTKLGRNGTREPVVLYSVECKGKEGQEILYYGKGEDGTGETRQFKVQEWKDPSG